MYTTTLYLPEDPRPAETDKVDQSPGVHGTCTSSLKLERNVSVSQVTVMADNQIGFFLS